MGSGREGGGVWWKKTQKESRGREKNGEEKRGKGEEGRSGIKTSMVVVGNDGLQFSSLAVVHNVGI